MAALQGADSAAAHKVQQLLIARERSNRYYTQQEVERELGLERGEIGKFYRTMNRGEGGNKKKATTLALLKEAGVFRIKRTKPKGQSTPYWIAFAGKGPAKRHPPPFFMSDAEHVFEFKYYTSEPAASVESDVDLEEMANEAGNTPSGHRPTSCTVMARSRRIVATPPPAAGGAYVSQNMGETMEEARMELRQLSFKISKCEIALESHGSYLGITDPAILLDQLKALQRKDEQLREMLLILMRTSPLHGPQSSPYRVANAAALLPDPQAPPHQAPPRQTPWPSRATLAPALTPPAPTSRAPTSRAPTTPTPTPPVSTPASGRARNLRRSCTLAETHDREKRARVAATNASAAAGASAAHPSTSLPRPPPPPTPAKISTRVAALTPSPLWSSSCPSHLTPRPKTTPAVPPEKTLSLYEALGLTPPPKASAPVAATGQSARTAEITNNGSGDTSRSSTPTAYFPGWHTLYRANIPRSEAVGGAGGSANGGKPPGGVRGKISYSSPAAGLRRCGHGAGIGNLNRHAERGRSQATASVSSTTRGRSSDEGPRAPERGAPANPPKNGDSTSGGEVSLAGGIRSTLAGAGAGQGVSTMATEMATAALAGPVEDRATVRDLADVAMTFNMRRSRVSSPAPAERQERAAGSGARGPSTKDIHGGGDKKMAAEVRRTTAAASPGVATSAGAPPSETGAQREAVATAAGKMEKKKLVEADGNGGDEAVVANPARSDRSATSTRGARECQLLTPTMPLRVTLCLTRSSAAAIVKSEAPTGSTYPSHACSTDAQAGTPAMQQGVEAAKPPARASLDLTPPGNAAPLVKAESAFGGNGVAKKPPVEMVSAEPDADASRRGNGDDGYEGRPPRKRRKSAQTGGWCSRYNADEFEQGEFSSSSTSDSDAESHGDVKQPRDGGVGGVGSVGTEGEEEGDAEGDDTLVDVGGDDILVDVGGDDTVVDVGGENSDKDKFGDDGGWGEGGGGGMRRLRLVNRRIPLNARKRRCADGTCLVGASFGFEGKPAVYCSVHKDAGMVNATYRRCEGPMCNRRPRFNMVGERAIYCVAHKRNGMVNVSAPRCIIPGCKLQPSFGFDGDTRATYCDAHKEPRMVNVRTRNYPASCEIRRPSSTSENDRSENGSIPRTEDAASAAVAAPPPSDIPCTKRPQDDLTPQPLWVYDPHVFPDSSIAQDSPPPLPLASTGTPAEIAAAAPTPTAPGSGTDGDKVDRVNVGGGASGTSAGAHLEEGAISTLPGVSIG